MRFKRIVAAGILICSLTVLPCALAIESQSAEAVVESIIVPEEIMKTQIPQTVENDEIILVKQQETKIKENKIEEVDDYVYTTERVNIRTYVGIESNILLTAEAGTRLHRTKTNVIEGWDMVLINEEKYYISNEYLTLDEPVEVAKTIEEQLKDSYISADDLRYMSAIIWAEAGNQCEAGQQAVGIVVMNRVASEIYKDTVYGVINEPYQFSPVKNGSFAKALSRYDSGSMPECVIDAAKYALQGNTVVNYNGTTYDLNGYLYFSRWVSNAKLTIQDHMFK